MTRKNETFTYSHFFSPLVIGSHATKSKHGHGPATTTHSDPATAAAATAASDVNSKRSTAAAAAAAAATHGPEGIPIPTAAAADAPDDISEWHSVGAGL